MMSDYPLGETLDFKFTTRAFATGIPTVLAGTPVVEIYEDNSVTQITAAETLTIDFDSVVGFNNLRVVATSGNGFESGKSYAAIISAGTVGGVSVVGEVIAQFSIERSPALRPSTAGRTLGVEADGDLTKVNTLDGHTAQSSNHTANVAAILADTGTTLPALLPAALVGGRMDADVGAKTGNVALSTQEKLDVNAEADTALTDYDPPTRIEATTDKDAIISQGDAAWTTGVGGTGLTALASGTAQTGAAAQITLASGEPATDNLYRYARCVITGGTGAGQSRFITGYTGSSKIATTIPDWEVDPDDTSTYELQGADASAILADAAHGGTAALLTLERIVVASNTTNEPAMKLTGDGAGDGLQALSAGTGDGISATGGATNGSGFSASSRAGNKPGMILTGDGSGAGIEGSGGATGRGARFIGGATSGVGMQVRGQGGNAIGFELVGAGSGKDIDAAEIDAIITRGDIAWTTGAGGTPPQLLQSTTIATLASQVEFTLTAGSADDDAYNGGVVIVTDASTSTQKAVGSVLNYVGSTRTITLSADPAIFTMAAGDTIDILAAISNAPTAADNRAEMDLNSTQLAAIVEDTDELQGDDVPGLISSLNDLSAAQVNTEVDNALNTAMPGSPVAGSVNERLKTMDDADIPAAVADIPTTPMRGTDNAATSAKQDTMETSLGTVTKVGPTRIEATADRDTVLTRLGAPAGVSVSADIAANQVDLGSILARLLTMQVEKNAAFSNFEFLMVLASDGRTPATGLTVTGQRSIDGGAFANVTGAITEVSDGIYQFDAVAADTNGDRITWRFSSGTADDTFVTFNTVI